MSISNTTSRRSIRWSTITRVKGAAEAAVGVVEAVGAAVAPKLRTATEKMIKHKKSKRPNYKRNHPRIMMSPEL